MRQPFTIIIPARLASTRLPEKLLKNIGDKTVIERSYLAAKDSGAARVIIATDDKKIFATAKQFGAEVVMTRSDHESGTDRLAECTLTLNLPDDEIIVNLQGDEPFMPAHFIDLCADTLANDSVAPMATLASRIHDAGDIDNPNVVKVVINQNGHALYFSRAPIPYNRDNQALNLANHYFHHLGIYAYRAGFLKRYSQLPPSEIEHIEKLEQLRVLDNGEKIAVALVYEQPPKGIDSAEDLAAAIAFFNRQ